MSWPFYAFCDFALLYGSVIIESTVSSSPKQSFPICSTLKHSTSVEWPVSPSFRCHHSRVSLNLVCQILFYSTRLIVMSKLWFVILSARVLATYYGCSSPIYDRFCSIHLIIISTSSGFISYCCTLFGTGCTQLARLTFFEWQVLLSVSVIICAVMSRD